MSEGAIFKYPFGEESCEHELEVLQDQYEKYYYNQGRFNTEVIDHDTYLIVGRRGSGKTSLAKYLEFQKVIENAQCIDVDEPEIYDETFREIVSYSSYPDDILTNRIVKFWNYLIWQLIFDLYRNHDAVFETAVGFANRKPSPARLIADTLKLIFDRLTKDTGGIVLDQLEDILSSAIFTKARTRALAIAQESPVIVAIDTIERYDKEDARLMNIVAALIQSANGFNVEFARQGIHVKVFVAAEIFPHIKESIITNTTKFIRFPVYLHWRPKDLVHLICWRFYRYLENTNRLPQGIQSDKDVEWTKFSDVHEKMWIPFFGSEITNMRNLQERSFPYLLRHTQMRPRQLVVLCNEIAKRSMKNGTYPFFRQENIADVIKGTERELANEVINSYARIYPRVGEIVDALHTSPMMFKGNYLDQIAKTTQYAWPNGNYSLANFRKLVAELGIVGRVRSFNEKSRIVGADFEYSLTERLPLRSSDDCVIHPMFYSKFHTKREDHIIVYPFPNHPDFDFESY